MTPTLQPSLRTPAERDALVLQWQCLPRWVVGRNLLRWEVRVLGREDAEGYGAIGLVRAAEMWDPARSAFSTFATRYIWGFIQTAARRHGSAIRVPSRHYDEGEPLPCVRRGVEKLDPPGRCADPADACAEADGDAVRLRLALGQLGPQEREILRLRMAGAQFREIGRELGFSGQYAQQVVRRAIARLRELLGAAG